MRAIVDLAGARSFVITPLRKDAVTLGADHDLPPGGAAIHREEIALTGKFRGQAVIAMENARLIDENPHGTRRRRSNVARTENRPGQSDPGGRR